jgi:hypothetical protein
VIITYAHKYACVCGGGQAAMLCEADVALVYKPGCTHGSKIQIRLCLKAFRSSLLPIFLDTVVLKYYNRTTIPWFRNFSPKDNAVLAMLSYSKQCFTKLNQTTFGLEYYNILKYCSIVLGL